MAWLFIANFWTVIKIKHQFLLRVGSTACVWRRCKRIQRGRKVIPHPITECLTSCERKLRTWFGTTCALFQNIHWHWVPHLSKSANLSCCHVCLNNYHSAVCITCIHTCLWSPVLYYNERFPWRDGLFDATWSEVNEAVIVVAGGDGNILIFDQSQPQVDYQTMIYTRKSLKIFLFFRVQ